MHHFHETITGCAPPKMRQNSKEWQLSHPEIKGSNTGKKAQNDDEGRPKTVSVWKTQKATHPEYSKWVKGLRRDGHRNTENKSEAKNTEPV